METNKIKALFSKNHFCLNCWLSIPNSLTAESMSKIGWDSITIDMQHGLNDYSTSTSMIQGIGSNALPMARVPWNEPGIIMKMLDLGVLGIIAPMINTKRECEEFVSYCNYPPLGQRSFGPIRAQLNYGNEYYNEANKQIVSLAMIETKEAFENIDDILSVPQLSGIYVGPADMSSSYGLKPQFDVIEDPVFTNIKTIAEKARKKGKIAGIHNGSTNYAKKMINFGYNFITILSDFRLLTSGAQNIVNEMKESKNKKTLSSNY